MLLVVVDSWAGDDYVFYDKIAAVFLGTALAGIVGVNLVLLM